MSYESNQLALRLFGELKEANAYELEEALKEGSLYMRTPCSAQLAGKVLKGLAVEVDDFDILYAKLYGRPVGKVFQFYRTARQRPLEEFNTLLNRFGKNVPALEAA